MRYGSVCSGIEAATVAWHGLGWQPAFFSEIEAFPRAVLQHHYPHVPLHGDFTTIKGDEYGSVDLLCGGTPCQSFSLAGLRQGLSDERGNLSLEFIRLAARLRPRWLVWENVPGVLSSNRGRDFGAFLGGLAECGYGFAYRVLDAQYFGVPQRRRRVVLVGYFGDWRPAATVLFERESLRRDITPSREARENLAGAITAGAFTGGAGGRPEGAAVNHFVVSDKGFETGPQGGGFIEIAPTLDARCKDGPIRNQIGAGVVSASVTSKWAKGSGAPAGDECQNLIAVHHEQTVPTLTSNGDAHSGFRDHEGLVLASPVAFAQNQLGEVRQGEVFSTLNTNSNASGRNTPLLASPIAWDEELNARENMSGAVIRGGDGGRHAGVMNNMAIRRLTPRECERLQGFPDDYTLVPVKGKPAADGPRYKAIGNSWAVPKFRWVGERIQMVEGLL